MQVLPLLCKVSVTFPDQFIIYALMPADFSVHIVMYLLQIVYEYITALLKVKLRLSLCLTKRHAIKTH